MSAWQMRWGLLLVLLMHGMGQKCSLQQWTLTTRCGNVLVLYDSAGSPTSYCVYDPSTCRRSLQAMNSSCKTQEGEDVIGATMYCKYVAKNCVEASSGNITQFETLEKSWRKSETLPDPASQSFREIAQTCYDSKGSAIEVAVIGRKVPYCLFEPSTCLPKLYDEVNDKFQYLEFLSPTLTTFNNKGIVHVGDMANSSFGQPLEIPSLILSNNLLTSMRNIKFPTSLDYLDISNNSLQTINDLVVPSISILRIQQNQIPTLGNIPQMTSLTSLGMGYNLLKELNATVLPRGLITLSFQYNQISKLSGTFPQKLTELDLKGNQINNITNVVFPRNITSLTLSNNALTALASLKDMATVQLLVSNNNLQTLNGIEAPQNVTTIDAGYNSIRSVTGSFPTTLKTLLLNNNQLTVMNEALPANLIMLTLDSNRLSQVPNGLGNALTTLNLNNNSIESIDAATFPSSLTSLYIGGNKIKVFNASALPSSLVTLDAKNANIETIVGTFPPNLQNLSLDNNLITAFYASMDQFKYLSRIPSFTYTSITTRNCANYDRVEKLNDEVSFCITKGGSSEQSATNYSTMITIIIGACSLVIILTISVLYYKYRLSQRIEYYDVNPHTKSFDDYYVENLQDLPYDIRFDENLTEFRIPQSDIHIEKVLARNTNSTLFKGHFFKKQIVIEKLIPASFHKKHLVVQFMHKIQMHSKLEHPKVLQFMGCLWHTIQDIALVVEYCDYGNVFQLLQADKGKEEEDKILQWPNAFYGQITNSNKKKNNGMKRTISTSNSSNSNLTASYSNNATAHSTPSNTTTKLQLKATKHHHCKLYIIADIAQALVYLHSFETPILHKDIKAKHVLINKGWVSKLNSFERASYMEEDGVDGNNNDDRGSEREHLSSLSSVQTSSIAWTAPEVLKGEPCTEKSDIYAFGMLISEIDLGENPYLRVSEQNIENNLSGKHIGKLIVADLLQPTFTPHCPTEVQIIAKKCLAYNSRDRPSAVEMEYWLQEYCAQFNV